MLSRKKSTPKKPTRASKEQPMPQRRRTPSSPKKVQRLKSPVPQVPSEKEGKTTTTRAGRAFPLHEKYDLDEVVSGTTKDRRKYYIVKANRLPRFEEEINVDLPAYFMHIHKEKDPRPRWLLDLPPKPSTRSYIRRWRSSTNNRNHLGMQSIGTTCWTAPARVPTLQFRLSTR